MSNVKMKIEKKKARQKLLLARDPVANEKIAKKLEREIRALERQ